MWAANFVLKHDCGMQRCCVSNVGFSQIPETAGWEIFGVRRIMVFDDKQPVPGAKLLQPPPLSRSPYPRELPAAPQPPTAPSAPCTAGAAAEAAAGVTAGAAAEAAAKNAPAREVGRDDDIMTAARDIATSTAKEFMSNWAASNQQQEQQLAGDEYWAGWSSSGWSGDKVNWSGNSMVDDSSGRWEARTWKIHTYTGRTEDPGPDLPDTYHRRSARRPRSDRCWCV